MAGWLSHLDVRHHLRRLAELRDPPEAIAGGLAIGMFLGFTPLYGVKTLLALGTAWALRCNKLAAVIAVSLHDLLFPLLPFLLRFEYDLGYWLLSRPHHLPPAMNLHHHHSLHVTMSWTYFLEVGSPILAGSLAVGAVSAVAVYFIAHPLLKHHQARLRSVAATVRGNGHGGHEQDREKE
jgi:hypothetical protein